jgi:hypothetical protein
MRRRRIAIRLTIFVLILAGIISLISWVSHFSFLTIDTIRVEGADPVQNQEIQKVAFDAISGDYLGIFSKSNALIFPRFAVANSIREHSLAIDKVELNLDDLHQLTIVLREKVASAIACFDFPELADSNLIPAGLSNSPLDNCYRVDRSGMVFGRSDKSDDFLNRYYVPDLPNMSSSTVMGSYATSTSEFLNLQDFYTKARTLSFNVESILIKSEGEYEMYMRNLDSSIVIVYFNSKTSFTDQLFNLATFWDYMVTNHKDERTTPSFDYIDLRSGANIYFRQNGGAIESQKK